MYKEFENFNSIIENCTKHNVTAVSIIITFTIFKTGYISPGYTHTAFMTGLVPDKSYYY